MTRIVGIDLEKQALVVVLRRPLDRRRMTTDAMVGSAAVRPFVVRERCCVDPLRGLVSTDEAAD